MTRERAVDAMRDALSASVNRDGGWPYYEGGASRLEPSCWAALALFETAASDEQRALLGSPFFAGLARGPLVLDAADAADNRPNFAFNALAAILLARGDAAAARRIGRSLVEHKGMRIARSKINRQDNSLQGWGWIDGTFSWVEPTSWCLIALKKVAGDAHDARERIGEAERLLADRCCDGGGWNYGNANMLGRALHAYVPTTALALLSLQDRRDEPCVVRSVRFLGEHRLTERSAMALALTLLALRRFGMAAGDVESCLVEQWERTGFLGNRHLAAMALYSLTAGEHGAEAFRV